MSKIMNTNEVAKYLKLNPATIRLRAEDGTIPAIRIGRVWRFSREVIDKWIEANLELWKGK